MSARGEYQASARPVRSATMAANGAARIRSWPASAIETSNSAATRARIGDITSTPAWLANSARNSTTVGEPRSAGRPVAAAGEIGGAETDDMCQRWTRFDRSAIGRTRQLRCGQPHAAEGPGAIDQFGFAREEYGRLAIQAGTPRIGTTLMRKGFF